MSTLKTEALRGLSGSADSIQLHASNQSVTFPGNVTCSGTATGMGGGKVLQVVSTAKTDTTSFSIGSESYNDYPGFNVAITPSATSSKILLIGVVNLALSGGEQDVKYWIRRNGSELDGARGDAASSRARATSGMLSYGTQANNAVAFQYLDSPSSTSAQTYNFVLSHSSGVTRTIYLNMSSSDADNGKYSRAMSSITAIEIGA